MAQPAFHARSASFPSRSHSLVLQIDENLCRINSSLAASSSYSTVNSNLSCLRDLYDSIDNLLLLPSTEQYLSQDCQKKQIGKLLDALLSNLDLCAAAKDTLAQTKEHSQQLFSILRRKRSDEFEFAIAEYLASRKTSKKTVRKSLKTLKRNDNISPAEKDGETKSAINILSQVQGVTLNVFESLLHLITGSMENSKPRAWSLASKLVRQKHVEDAATENEFASVDTALTRIAHKATKSCNMKNEDLQSKLEALESCIRDLEDELDYQYRQLIKIRVCLLNILSY